MSLWRTGLHGRSPPGSSRLSCERGETWNKQGETRFAVIESLELSLPPGDIALGNHPSRKHLLTCCPWRRAQAWPWPHDAVLPFVVHLLEPGVLKELAQAQSDRQVVPESGVELPVTLVDVSQDGRVLDWVPPNCGPFNVDQANRTTGPNQRHQVVDDGLLAPTVVRKDVAQHHHVSTFGDEPVASVAPSLKTSLASVVG